MVARDRAALVNGTLVPALATALGSSNAKIAAEAGCALEALGRAMDAALLAPALAQVLQFGSGGAKGARPALAIKLAELLPALQRSRPGLVCKVVLPAAMALLGEARAGGELRGAQGALMVALAQAMGPSLLEYVATLSPAVQQRVKDALNAVR